MNRLPTTRMSTRRLGFLASVLVVVWATVAVQLPFYETRPGGAHVVEDLISVSAASGEIDGDLSLLTVKQVTSTPLQAILAMLSSDRQLRPIAERTPPDVDRDAQLQQQASQFGSAFTTAMAVAAIEVGYDIEVTSVAMIAQVLEDGPSDGLLVDGDEVVAIDGLTVDAASALVAQLQTKGAGDDVVLDLVRDGEAITVTVTLELLSATDRPGLGVLIETVPGPIELPFDASIGETRIGGPSAGLMFALTAVDLLLDEDLAAGRHIAGTGTIEADGTVGPIGGIEQKVEAAIDADADLLLVPFDQAGLATSAADGRIEVIGVATLADAVDALRGRGDVAAPA